MANSSPIAAICILVLSSWETIRLLPGCYALRVRQALSPERRRTPRRRVFEFLDKLLIRDELIDRVVLKLVPPVAMGHSRRHDGTCERALEEKRNPSRRS